MCDIGRDRRRGGDLLGIRRPPSTAKNMLPPGPGCASRTGSPCSSERPRRAAEALARWLRALRRGLDVDPVRDDRPLAPASGARQAAASDPCGRTLIEAAPAPAASQRGWGRPWSVRVERADDGRSGRPSRQADERRSGSCVDNVVVPARSSRRGRGPPERERIETAPFAPSNRASAGTGSREPPAARVGRCRRRDAIRRVHGQHGVISRAMNCSASASTCCSRLPVSPE
jgi:hypothetical protein